MSSAAEVEVGALFMNAQEAIPFRTCLEDLGHPQKATPINTDNATAQGIVNVLGRRVANYKEKS